MKLLLGIDLGTSATKTVLFDEKCRVLASAAQEYPLLQPQNGWAEQDPEEWWAAASATIRRVLSASGADPRDIAGIGLSGQMHGLIMLDGEGRVLRPSILWCDQRTADECEEITRTVGRERLIRITANPAVTGFTASKLLWVRRHEPEVYARCRHILLPKDYLRYRLTGVFATDVSDASGMQLLDVPHRCWSEELLQLLDIDRSWLAEVHESTEITGGVSADAAAGTGLCPGTPVVAGAGDNAAAAVGTGAVTDGSAFTTLGTSGVVYVHTDRPRIDPQGRVHTFCCAVAGCWHVMGVTQAAGLSLRWVRDTMFSDEIRAAQGMGIDPYVLMDRQAARVPAGSDRLLYLPYLMGERTPHLDPHARGAFVGLSAVHTRYAMLRAVMEGVAFSQRDSLSVIRELGVQTQRMLVCGGGGRSALWRQILCDVYGIPLSVPQAQEGPAMGAAILAAVGAGLYPDVPAACHALLHSTPSETPDAEKVRVYEQMYAVYRGLYPALRDSFRALSDVACEGGEN